MGREKIEFKGEIYSVYSPEEYFKEHRLSESDIILGREVLEAIPVKRAIHPTYEAILDNVPLDTRISLGKLARANKVGDTNIVAYAKDWALRKGYVIKAERGKGTTISKLKGL